SIVQKNANLIQNIMKNAGAEDIHIESYKQFMKMRRKAAKQMVGTGFYTISVPSVSSGIFMKRIKSVSAEISVIAHPKTGRFHIVCNDDSLLIKLRESALAIGGKLPLGWEHLHKKNIGSFLTEAELSIARSLKRELDPQGIFNPHLKLL
ncbi:MAG TPA: FAD-linked oxidase C-terminal domain-containing protein, partial [Anaerolineae bacterium]|nr:FAD-linked oxidase C-terminal domain-containing protein [Anaerolineae bacterium]